MNTASTGACPGTRGSRRRQDETLCERRLRRIESAHSKLITSDRLSGLFGPMTSIDALPDDVESLK